MALSLLMAGTVSSCIEPPLKLPAQDIIIDMPIVLLDLDVVWDIDVAWQNTWYYDWDQDDIDNWGEIKYPEPTEFELRRYYIGKNAGAPHTSVDPRHLPNNRFRSTYEFGYYDMLIWSSIEPDEYGSVVVKIDEEDLEEVHATTSITKGMAPVFNIYPISTGSSQMQRSPSSSTVVTGLYNQPEIFYSKYLTDIHISRDPEDYDYYDEAEGCWVKRINSSLEPLVYIYLVQVIIHNNIDGRVVGCSGDNAISAFASGTSVNTGHTWNSPCLVYFGSRFKKDVNVDGEKCDIIGGKLTTYGLCDMDSYGSTRASSNYTGSRTDLTNYLYVDVKFSNNKVSTLQIDVTDQCRKQAHGGVITVHVDATQLKPPPSDDNGSGSLFVPTVEDYDEVVYDIIM